MTNLTSNDFALLPAMMSTIGTIWSIGLVAYVFIFQYLKDTLKDNATPKRLLRYSVVFSIYMIAGLFTGACLLLSGMALAFDRLDLIPWAGATFFLSLLMLVGALSYEIGTSVAAVLKLRRQMDKAS